MDSTPLASMAESLISARQQHTRIDAIEPALSSTAEALELADRVASLSGWTVNGWKIGCTSPRAQELLGTDGPFSGRIYRPIQSGTTAEPVVLGPADVHQPMLEGEFAFTVGADLPARSEPYTRPEIEAALSTLHPAIEVVDPRIVGFPAIPILALIADAGANAHLVVGPGTEDWRNVDLTTAAVSMSVDGTVTGAGTGSDVLGHPLDAVAWLLTHLSARGIGLTAGQIITTGTCTQVSPLPVGSTAIADFGPFGTAAITRSGETP